MAGLWLLAGIGCDAAPAGSDGGSARDASCFAVEQCGNGVDDDCDPTTLDVCPLSCAELLDIDPRAGDGIHLIYPLPGDGFEVQCDLSGGGWTLAVSTPEEGYASIEEVDEFTPLSAASRGRLPDEAIAALLGAAPPAVNNVRVEVGRGDTFPRWTVSMRATGGAPGDYRVPSDANGGCDAYDPGPDAATLDPAAMSWGFANGSNGGATGWLDAPGSDGRYAGFVADNDGGTDMSCGATRAESALWVQQRGRLWVR